MRNKAIETPEIVKYTQLSVFALSIIPAALFLYIAIQRLGLPINLEWGEGAGFNQIQRIIMGLPVYVRPTVEFSPLVYTPLYYYLAAGAAKLMGSIFTGARLVSLLASLAGAALIGWLVSKKTTQPLAGWFSAVFYLGCFALSGGFYDLIRVDSLYVLFCLLALTVFIIAETPVAFAAVGLLVAVSFYVKQSAILVFIPLLIYSVIRQLQRSWTMALTSVAGILIPSLILNSFTDGWFGYYIFHLPRQHGFSILSLIGFWTGDLARAVGIAGALGIAWYLIGETNTRNGSEGSTKTSEERGLRKTTVLGLPFLSRDKWIFGMFAVGAIGAAWLTRSSNGGGANNLMTAFAALAILLGLGWDSLFNRIPSQQIGLQLAVWVVIAIQFLGLIYNPFDFLPGQREIKANQSLLTLLAETDKPVLMPYQSNLPAFVGKDPSIHAVNLFELTGYFHGEIQPDGPRIIQQIQQAICKQSYSLIILDQPLPWFDEQIQSAYEKVDLGLRTEDGRNSQVLSWQKGFLYSYQPKGNPPDHCQASNLDQ